MMISKISTIALFVLLVGSDCFASASPLKYSEEAEQALTELSGGQAWRFEGQSLSQQLLKSSREGNVKALAQVLATRRVNPDFTKDHNGLKQEFALQEAIEGMRTYKKGQQVECIKLLLLCGANPNRELKRWPGRTLIFRAVQLSDSALVKALLQGGADATVLDCHGNSILHWTQWAINDEDRRARSLLEKHFIALLWRAVDKKDAKEFMRLFTILRYARELSNQEQNQLFGVPNAAGLTLFDCADQLRSHEENK